MDTTPFIDTQKYAQNTSVRRREVVMNTWGHIVEEGTDWTEALSRAYWLRVADKFRPGDRVEVHSFDHRVQFSMLILDCNTSSDPVFLDLVFQAIHPANLQLPALEPQRLPRYAVRQAPASSAFRVIDLESGEPVHDNVKPRPEAMELAAELERGAAFSLGQVARVVAVKAKVTPGALRTRKYRQKQRGASRPVDPAPLAAKGAQ